METPKEFFEAPEGWSWEREWGIEPMKSSLVTDDFVLKKWTDNRYEAMDASDPDGDVWLWFNQVSCIYIYMHLHNIILGCKV